MKARWPQAPRPDVNLSEEEKARIARRFRRGAILADAASVLFFGLVLALVLLWRFSGRLPDPLLFTLLAAIPLSMAGVLLGELLLEALPRVRPLRPYMQEGRWAYVYSDSRV